MAPELQNAVEIAKDLLFDRKAFCRRFDDKIAVRQQLAVKDAVNGAQRGLDLSRRRLAAGKLALHVLLDRLETAIEEALLDFTKQHGKTAASEDLGNAAAHGPGANDANALNPGVLASSSLEL